GRHARQADPATGLARGGRCRGAPAVAGGSGPRLPQLLPEPAMGQGGKGTRRQSDAAGSEASVQVPPSCAGGQVHPEQPLQGAGGRPPIAAEGGRLKVRWSRNLPSGPSSVPITLDRAGRSTASFVVEAVAAPLAPAESAVGIDLGLTSFAALSDGRKVDNPQW